VPWPFTSIDIIDSDLTELGFEIVLSKTYADYLDAQAQQEEKEWGESYDYNW
jgi:hypothetical protein